MTKVLLYCRVSTDDQTKGCSLEMQEQILRLHCRNLNYEIIGEPYKEDYSAKDYYLKRPVLKKLFEYCKKHTREVDKVLFLRWDRFTRNLEFGTTYKRKFIDEMGIEINSVENPIDFNIPEWSSLLAIYIGAAQTENLKNSKRTKEGMHGSRLKGKLMGKAPRGYRNVRLKKHEGWVEINETEAPKIKALFTEVAKGQVAPLLIRNRLYPKLAKSSFFRILRNPFYAGYAYVDAYAGDKEQYIKGQHDAIIDKETFDKVQEILDGKRKKQPKATRTINSDLYLRRILVCPICGNILTGAFSKGNGGKYPYYFCNREHKHLNMRAEKVNEGFIEYISALKPNKAIVELYSEILNDIRGERTRETIAQINKMENEIMNISERINRVTDLFIDGDITKAEKEAAIERYNRQIETTENQIQSLKIDSDSKMKEKIKYSINLIENLGEVFREATPEVKLKIIGSIFPEKVEFDGKNYRTNSYNQILEYIFQNINQLQEKRTENDLKNHSQSHLGCPVGLEPTTFRTTI